VAVECVGKTESICSKYNLNLKTDLNVKFQFEKNHPFVKFQLNVPGKVMKNLICKISSEKIIHLCNFN
jgi:hypothetical protein